MPLSAAIRMAALVHYSELIERARREALAMQAVMTENDEQAAQAREEAAAIGIPPWAEVVDA